MALPAGLAFVSQERVPTNCRECRPRGVASRVLMGNNGRVEVILGASYRENYPICDVVMHK